MKTLLMLLLLTTSACGMQGELYLPGDEAQGSSPKTSTLIQYKKPDDGLF